MTATLDDALIRHLAGRVSGRVLAPHQAGYDAARAVHNGLVDRRPALIVRCRTSGRHRRGAGLPASGGAGGVGARRWAQRRRPGGHRRRGDDRPGRDEGDHRRSRARDRHRPGRGDLRRAERRHRRARVGGDRWGGVHDRHRRLHPRRRARLADGQAGLAADNLDAIELVTAAGEVLHVDASSHPDLFWALRGGGGNFGVATAFTYRLHPLGTVTGGLIAHPFEAAPELLRFYRDAVADASDDLTVFAGLVHAPDGSDAKLAALVVFHAGDPEVAERELAPFRTFGSPLTAQVGPLPYPVMNTLLDAGYPDGARNYWLSGFTRGLSDTLIATAVERFATVPSPMTAILLEHFHGAVTRVGPTATAVPHRAPGWNLLIPSVWTDPAGTDANVGWTRDTFAALRPHLGAGRWLNYLGDDQGDDAVRAAYGPNHDRLRDVKRRYDPDNVFHLNHNIVP